MCTIPESWSDNRCTVRVLSSRYSRTCGNREVCSNFIDIESILIQTIATIYAAAVIFSIIDEMIALELIQLISGWCCSLLFLLLHTGITLLVRI